MTDRRAIAWLVGGGSASLAVLGATAFAWLALVAGSNSTLACGNSAAGTPVQGAPPSLRPLFAAAAAHYRLGAEGPSILAGLTSVESRFGKDMGPSSAGAIGWTQFMPETWRRYGVDADGDGKRDPLSPADAIFAAARYLRASGAPANWYMALFAYNHADWYVKEVLARAGALAGGAVGSAPAACAAGAVSSSPRRVGGPADMVAIPGFPTMRVDRRILADAVSLIRLYHLAVTAAFASTGHEPDGEHPLGLALDLIPGPGRTWDDVDRLAHWAEPVQNAPRPPFRWVGYDGDSGHGRGNHLHLSWDHAPAQAGARVRWVETLGAPRAA